MGNLIPYRWTFKTFIPNISYAILTIRCGIKNLVLWFPIIFFNDWIDWTYLTRIMEFQIRIMANKYKKYGQHINSDKTARQLLICSFLLKRLTDDNYWEHHKDYKKEEQIADYDKELLFKLMNKHLKAWWN